MPQRQPRVDRPGNRRELQGIASASRLLSARNKPVVDSSSSVFQLCEETLQHLGRSCSRYPFSDCEPFFFYAKSHTTSVSSTNSRIVNRNIGRLSPNAADHPINHRLGPSWWYDAE